MKQANSFLLLLVFSLSVQAQSIQVATDESTRGNSTSEFTLDNHTINIRRSSLGLGNASLRYSTADVGHTGTTALINQDGVQIFDSNGAKLTGAAYSGIGDDSSLKIYSTGNGGFVIRENIANFLVYDSFGNIKQSVSNSSQSQEGESISELASDPFFKTIVLYNPKIVMNGLNGSRARIVQKNNPRDIFNSQDRAIRFVKVSKNGQFIAIVNYNPGTDDQVRIMDRFGNILNTLSFSQDIAGVNFSEDGRHITLYSTGRAGAYSVLSGERLGSTSFRSGPLRFAEYVPADQTIIGLTADEAGNTYQNIELHAVNVSARKIARKEFDQALGVTDLIDLNLERTSRYRYTLTGLSQTLNLRASF